MATIYEGGLSSLRYVIETTIGTTPATPTTILLPTVEHSINYNKNTIDDPSIGYQNNMKPSIADGNSWVDGYISVKGRHAQYDDLLMVALQGTWATNVLKMSNTEQAVTVEEHIETGTTDIFNVSRGVEIPSVEITAKANELIDVKFNLLGLTHAAGGTTPLTASPTAIQTAKTPFVTCNGVMTLDGTAYPITDFSLKISNGISPKYAIASAAAYGFASESNEVTGSMTFLLKDQTVLTKFISGATAAIIFTMSDGTNTHTYSIPSVKYRKWDKKVNKSAITASVDFEAIYNSTLGSLVSVTRT